MGVYSECELSDLSFSYPEYGGVSWPFLFDIGAEVEVALTVSCFCGSEDVV